MPQTPKPSTQPQHIDIINKNIAALKQQ